MTINEYKALQTKAKVGWLFYYTLLENDFVEAERNIKELQNIIELVDEKEHIILNRVRALLNRHKNRVKCCICLENNLTKNNAQVLKCLHRFHKECLKLHREHEHSYKCPECRPYRDIDVTHVEGCDTASILMMLFLFVVCFMTIID